MSRAIDREGPDRLYVITSGRSRGGDEALDAVTLIVAESDPLPGMQSEHVRILRMCRRPTAVVEIAARLELPVTVVRILLTDLLDAGHATARHPAAADPATASVSPAVLEKVLVALHNL
ncbi:DUF742 domain-containing protein [Thermobifida alba]|jgi:hypothetical protein|uniref:DUF742 domain-containing protein n=1 Tax=Thermobifida alba TaxID=53522 RepID=A0ABY4L7P5_THEAE|nr:DUF742 domain-containing protein [Thermobifida alba]UPT22112.1 DUF742 domain-containing protein [Thermobifida alba]HLU96965.1 DUF742 domain-containing protein [Thermobifida alba]